MVSIKRVVRDIGLNVQGSVSLGVGGLMVSVGVTPFNWRLSLEWPQLDRYENEGAGYLDWRLGPIDLSVSLDWDLT